jgi:hypothetical protein
MVKHVFIFFFLIVQVKAMSQTTFSNSARSLSLANASVTLQDVWAQVNNPAALVGMKNHAFGISTKIALD